TCPKTPSGRSAWGTVLWWCARAWTWWRCGWGWGARNPSSPAAMTGASGGRASSGSWSGPQEKAGSGEEGGGGDPDHPWPGPHRQPGQLGWQGGGPPAVTGFHRLFRPVVTARFSTSSALLRFWRKHPRYRSPYHR